jgi:transcription elongation factor Elf1
VSGYVGAHLSFASYPHCHRPLDENKTSLSNMALPNSNELIPNSQHAQTSFPSHRHSFDAVQSISSRRTSPHWQTPPSSADSSPLTSQSRPSINITPPLDETVPSLDGRYSRNMSGTPISSVYALSPQYSHSDSPYHDAHVPTMDMSMPQKFTADWVQQVNQMSFEPIIIDASSEDSFLSGPMQWRESQNSSELQLPHSGIQLWSNPQWAAMQTHDSSTSSNLTSMAQSLYLSASSTHSSPFSSPHSPLSHDYTSVSPLTTPSLSRNPTPEMPQPSKGKICSHCKATSTPLWRRDPRTQNQLCNACGLYLQQRNKLRPQQLIDADSDEPLQVSYPPNAPECSHCHTRNTSVWRRSKDGAQLCNACGVYRRLRGKDRPLSLKRNRIKPRTKHNTV